MSKERAQTLIDPDLELEDLRMLQGESTHTFICFVILSCLVISHAVSFEECDTDLSRLLTRIELRACFQEEWGAGVMSEDRFIDLFDRDGDGGISSAEYRLALENMRGTTLEGQMEDNEELGDAAFEEVDIQLRDGTVRTLSKEDFFSIHQAQMDAVQGSEEPEESEVQDLEELKVRNPELSRFIQLAQWVVGVMARHYSQVEGNTGKDAHFPEAAKMLELRSLPPGGSLNRGKEKGTDSSPSPDLSGMFDIYLELSIHVNSAKKGERKGAREEGRGIKPADPPLARDIRKYEFHVVGNPLKYRVPHAAIISCWELNNDGLRIDTLDVPAPRLYPQGGGDAGFTGSVFSFGAAATLWRSMSSSQRLIAALGCIVLGLAFMYFVILPCTFYLVMAQVGKDDD